MHVSLSTVVPGVSPDDACRWWSDFQEGHADHTFVPGATRRITRREARTVSMEETTKWLGLRVFRERVTAHLREREVGFSGENDYATFDGAYSFAPEGTGTCITLRADIRLRPAIRWTDVAAKPVVLAILQADLRGHAKEMQRDLKAR